MKNIRNLVLACERLFLPKFLRWLNKNYNLTRVGCSLRKKQLITALEKADAFVMAGEGRITAEMNALYPDLIYIFVGIGERTYFDEDVYGQIMKEGRIYKTGGGQEAVAQTTFEQMRCFSQPERIQIEMTRKFQVAPSAAELLKDQTVVVIGAGNIGQRVMEKAASLYGRVIYTGGRGEKPELKVWGFEYVPVIGDAIAQSQIVSVHLDLIPGVTEGILRYDDLARIPKGGLLINNARANVVFPQTLLMFLSDRTDVTVQFDHFYKEGGDYADIENNHHGLLYKIIRKENFRYTGHTAAQRLSTFKEYGENLRRILEKMQKGA